MRERRPCFVDPARRSDVLERGERALDHRPTAAGVVPSSSVSTRDVYGLGYERVDDDPNVSVLLGTMDATARIE